MFAERPYLTFKREDETTEIVLITKGTLGQGMNRTPLQGEIRFLNSGKYKLSITFPNIRSIRKEGKEIKITLGIINIK